jgi:co-chaperonin GroES (HSP10)|tara:strand:+ start:2219 stop:2476 length:258 start_codon:yes stop_codon:yes gene_type:complete
MKAINSYIIIEDMKEGPKKVGGLILTEELDSDNRYVKSKVISVGNLVEGINEKDVVYYDKHAGHNVTWKDKVYKVILSRDVVIIE